MGSIEVQVIRIATPFSTTDEFVGTFKNYVTEDSCFVPSTTMKTVGLETGFSIRLADGTPVLRGLGVVLDSWATDENPWRKPGIRIGLRKLTKETKAFFDELQHARLARGSREIIPTGQHAPLAREALRDSAPPAQTFAATSESLAVQMLTESLARQPARRAESVSDVPPAIETPTANAAAPVVISFFDANNEADDDEADRSAGRPTRSLRVVETDRVVSTDAARSSDACASAFAADCGVPMEISEETESATERVEMTDLPVRSDVATLLGFAPLPKPERASTERERDTVLGMPPIDPGEASEGLVAVGPIAIESMAVPSARPHTTTLPMTVPAPTAPPSMPMRAQLPLMAQVVSLPGLAHLWDPPELAALAALETTAIIERPRRRVLTQWIERLVWRVRAWYRTRSMR
jgi:hypothetical protein